MAMAYERVLPAHTFAKLADPQVQAQLTEQIGTEIGNATCRVLVALDGERIVGFSFVRPAVVGGESVLEAADTDAGKTGYLEQVLVEPRWGRRGHGSRLLAASAEFFTGAGLVRAVTWVPEQNSATLEFLTSAGWARDGYTRGFDADGTTVREVRLHTAL